MGPFPSVPAIEFVAFWAGPSDSGEVDELGELGRPLREDERCETVGDWLSLVHLVAVGRIKLGGTLEPRPSGT